jgi:multicomponent K+:H+ antiporter subunit E
MMKRLLPYPLLWLGLLVMWLLLNASISPGQVLLGAVVASLACWAAAPLTLPKPKLRRITAIAALIGVFVRDVLRSNIAVMRTIVTGREPHSMFVTIPLELTEPNALAVLAGIITATPGSAWIQYEAEAGTVIIHVLDTADDAEWVAALKRNYESRLMEIFQ